VVVEPLPVIVVEGILVLAEPELRAELDLKVFVDTAADIRLARRIERDIEERGRTVTSVIGQYFASVRPMHMQFVEPSKTHADLTVGGEEGSSGREEVLGVISTRLG
jgi:uridine kinase